MGKLAWVGGVAVAAFAAAPAVAMQTGDGARTEIVQRLRAHDDAEAARLIERYLERKPDDPVMLYNAACVRCRLGEPDRAAPFLLRSIKAGFSNFSHLRRDPDLRPMRDHAIYRAIVAARDAADSLFAERRLERWQSICSDEAYRLDPDPRTRLTLLAALDEGSLRSTRDMLGRQAAGLEDLLGMPATPRHEVLIVIPRPQDLQRLLDRPNVAGVYRHGQRELVTADADRALRHEFVHVLHHSHMDALGQEHPLWIQEGLALLFESWETAPDGTIRFTANDRHALVAMLARTGRLIPWPNLLAMSSSQLDRDSARTYPELRSLLRFVAEEGRLGSWYHAYVERFDRDPSGIEALEAVFDAPLAEVEARWRTWLRKGAEPVGKATLS